MSWFENFRQQNQHLFGEDSDFSDSEPEFEPEENEKILYLSLCCVLVVIKSEKYF